MDEPLEEDIEYYAERPNKSQIKRDIAVLHALAEEIVALSVIQMETLKLPLDVFEAAKAGAKITQRGARKRHLKFLTGLLRKIDVEPIKADLAKMKTQSALAVKEHHLLERWRDRLLAEGDQALFDLLQEYPDTDRQQLRQLIRNANKEAESEKPPKTSRMIYQFLKTLIATHETESNKSN